MPTIPEIRAKFPQYNDMSDDDLAEGLHKKYYSDMPFGEFAGKIGYRRNWSDIPGQAKEAAPDDARGMIQGLGHAVMNPTETVTGLASLASGAINNAVPQLSSVDAWLAEQGLKEPSNPEVVAQQRQAASQMGANIADTLTTKEGFKHYIAKSPVSAATDIAAALTGGAALTRRAAGVTTKGTLKERTKAAPSAETIASETKQKFADIRAGDHQLPADKFRPARDELLQYLKGEGITATDAPQATNQVNRLTDVLPAQKPAEPFKNVYGITQHPVPQPDMRSVPFNQIESIRRGAGRVERATNLTDTAATDKMVAGKLKKTIDKLYDEAADPTLKGKVADAREMGRRNILIKQIKEMSRKAEDGYASGAESGYKNQFSAYLRSEKGKGLSAEEKAAFKKVAQREGIANALTTLGSRLGLLGTYMTTGPEGVVASMASRKIMEALTRKAATKAEKTVAIGQDAQKAGTQAARQLRLERIAKALLAAEAGH